MSDYIRRTCIVGPVTGEPGRGFLLGLRTSRPAKQIQAELLEGGILAGTASDSHIVRLLPPFILREEHVEHAARRAREPARMKRFLDLADLEREEVLALLELARRLETRPEPHALAGKILGLLFLNPSLRTLASFQAGMARLGGSSFVITPGQGTWQLETRLGAVMSGAAAEHVREGIPVLASYCDALGVRAFADGKDLAADLAETAFSAMASLVDKPLINLESAMSHPCQALADWKTMDDLGVPRSGRFVLSWAYHPRALPLAVPATAVHMAALRGMEVSCCGRRDSRCRSRSWTRRGAPRRSPAAPCGRPPIATRR